MVARIFEKNYVKQKKCKKYFYSTGHNEKFTQFLKFNSKHLKQYESR